MSAIAALALAREANVSVIVDGRDLILESTAAPPNAVIEMLAQHKEDLVALLSHSATHGGLSCERLIIEWLMHHPVCSSPGYCLWCGSPEGEGKTVLPFGTHISGHAWLHSECWSLWHAERRRHAAMGLGALGVRGQLRS